MAVFTVDAIKRILTRARVALATIGMIAWCVGSAGQK